MLTNINYIIDDCFSFSTSAEQGDLREICIVPEVSPDKTSIIKNPFFFDLAEKSGCDLSFYFPERLSTGYVIQQELLALSFFPGFRKITGNPVFFCKNKKMQVLEDLFINTGYEAIHIINNFLIMNDSNALDHLSDKDWIAFIELAKPWLIRVNSVQEIERVNKIVVYREKDLFRTNQEIMNVLIQLQQKRKELEEARNEALFYKQRSGMMEDIFISRTEKSEALQIQEFYNKEYEILPGWYKKLGHIIKRTMWKKTNR